MTRPTGLVDGVVRLDRGDEAAAPVTAFLDWEGFSARFFPGRRRHDLKVLKAYEAYRNGLFAERHDRLAEAQALGVWEGEGGTAE